MKNRDIFWWLLAITAALIAGIMTFTAIKNRDQLDNEQSALQTVVVAVTNIPMRRTIDLLELTTRMVPADAIPAGAATSLEQVVGQMSTVEVFPNQPLVLTQLMTPDQVTRQIALTIPDGKNVTSVPTTSQLVRNRLIRPGDRVDLLATIDIDVKREMGNKPLATSVVLLENVEVYAVILPSESLSASGTFTTSQSSGVFRTSNAMGQSVLFALSQQDAIAIRHVQDIDGKLDLTLRADSNLTPAVVPVDQYYLAERYGIAMARGQVAKVGFVSAPIYAPDVDAAYAPDIATTP